MVGTLLGFLIPAALALGGGLIAGSKAKRAARKAGESTKGAFKSGFGDFFRKTLGRSSLGIWGLIEPIVNLLKKKEKNSDVISPDLGNSVADSASGYLPDVSTGASSAQQVEDVANNPSIQGVTDAAASQAATSQGSGAQGAEQAGMDYNSLLSLLLGDSDFSYFDYSGDVADQRKYGEQMISDARQWEQAMADTRYQRAVEDIKAAGLNPWLALQSGSSISPATVGSVDTGSALGSISMSNSNGMSNSSSAIMVALISALSSALNKSISLVSK